VISANAEQPPICTFHQKETGKVVICAGIRQQEKISLVQLVTLTLFRSFRAAALCMNISEQMTSKHCGMNKMMPHIIIKYISSSHLIITHISIQGFHLHAF